MNNKYLIIGDGFIGDFIYKVLEEKGIGPIMCFKKLYTEKDIAIVIGRYKNHIIINCAGKTGRPNIDWCELHRAETAFANVTLPLMISKVCRTMCRYWIHIGSGCIYDGYQKRWTEKDRPNFFGSFYSITKMMSQEVLKEDPNCLILRIRMPIAGSRHPRSYITKLVDYARKGFPIIYNLNSMTVLKDFINVILKLSEQRITGTFNAVNEDYISPCEILKIYKNKVDSSLTWTEKSYPEVRKEKMKADRSNCILSTEKLNSYGLTMPDIKERIISII